MNEPSGGFFFSFSIYLTCEQNHTCHQVPICPRGGFAWICDDEDYYKLLKKIKSGEKNTKPPPPPKPFKGIAQLFGQAALASNPPPPTPNTHTPTHSQSLHGWSWWVILVALTHCLTQRRWRMYFWARESEATLKTVAQRPTGSGISQQTTVSRNPTGWIWLGDVTEKHVSALLNSI